MSHAPQQSSESHKNTMPYEVALNTHQNGVWQKIKDRLWGFDFFISYHWASGGVYAVNLAQMLRSKGFDVFLDRSDYAAGDDWKKTGEAALRNTQRLILIATNEAVFCSKPVEHEVIKFSNRSRHIVPIVFGYTLNPEASAPSGYSEEVWKRIRGATLGIPQPVRIPKGVQYPPDSSVLATRLNKPATDQVIPSSPSKRVVNDLIRTHKVLRRRNLRALIALIPIIAVIAFAAFATVSWGNAELERSQAIEARDSEKKARLEENRQRKIAEQRATNLTIADGYRLVQLGSEQLAAWNTEEAAGSFVLAQQRFEKCNHNPLMSWNRRLAADLSALSKERLFQTQYGRNLAGLLVSDDGAFVALIFEYNDIDADTLKTVPAVEVWDTTSRKLVLSQPALSDVGKQLSRYWSQDGDLSNTPTVEVDAVLPSGDLVVRKRDNAGTGREQLSLRDGAVTPYITNVSAEDAQHLAELRRLPLKVSFENTTLKFQPRHAEGSVSISGFFGRDPATGNDRMYKDPFGERPDLLRAESFDGGRLLVGTYEGTMAMFECHTYGTQLRRGRIGPIRGVRFVGKSRTAIAVDETGIVWRISEDHPAIGRTGLKRVGKLAFSPDGSTLVAVSDSKVAAYDVARKQILSQHDVGNGQAPLAFGHSNNRRTAYALFPNGDLLSLDYDRSESPAEVKTIRPLKDARLDVRRSIVAGFDFYRDLVWIGIVDAQQGNMSVAGFPLAKPDAPVHSKILPLGDVEQLGGMVCRRDEILLFVTARSGPGIDDLDGATVLVRFDPDTKQEPTYTKAFKPGTERYYNDWRGWVPRVDQILDTPSIQGEYVRLDLGLKSGTFPLTTPLSFAPHRLSRAMAISQSHDRGANITVAVTQQSGINIYTEDAERNLSYELPAPLIGFLAAAAVSSDGQKVAIATSHEDAIVIDVGVFAVKTNLPKGDDVQGSETDSNLELDNL